LHGLNKGGTGEFALQTTELVGADDNDFIPSMQRYMLRTLAAYAPDKFTEAGLRILQSPITRAGSARPAAGRTGRSRRFLKSGHSDQIIMSHATFKVGRAARSQKG
jgi:hypothetical protein